MPGEDDKPRNIINLEKNRNIEKKLIMFKKQINNKKKRKII